MPVRVRIEIEDDKSFVRVIQERSSLTPRQVERLAQGLASALNGPDSLWPKKGEGVRGNATGYSRRHWHGAGTVTTDGVVIDIFNTARAISAGGIRSGAFYARFAERGDPNPASEGRARRTLRKVFTRVVRRVLR